MAKGDFTNDSILKAIDLDYLGAMPFFSRFIFLSTFDFNNLDLNNINEFIKIRQKIIKEFESYEHGIYIDSYYFLSTNLKKYFNSACKYLIEKINMNTSKNGVDDNTRRKIFTFIFTTLSFLKLNLNDLAILFKDKKGEFCYKFVEQEIEKEIKYNKRNLSTALDNYKKIINEFFNENNNFFFKLIYFSVGRHLNKDFETKKHDKDYALCSFFYVCTLDFYGFNVFSMLEITMNNYNICDIFDDKKVLSYDFKIIKINMSPNSGRSLLLKLLEKAIHSLNLYNNPAIDDEEKKLQKKLKNELCKEIENEYRKKQYNYIKNTHNNIYIPVLLKVSSENINSFHYDFFVEIFRYLYKCSIINLDDYNYSLKIISFILNMDSYTNLNEAPNARTITQRLDDISMYLHKILKSHVNIFLLIDKKGEFNKYDLKKLNSYIKYCSLYGMNVTAVEFIEKKKKPLFEFKLEYFYKYFSRLNNDTDLTKYSHSKYIFDNKGSIMDVSNFYNINYLNEGLSQIPLVTVEDIENFYEDKVDARIVVRDIYNIIISHNKKSQHKNYNIAIIGNYGIGKTSIISILLNLLNEQYRTNNFDHFYGCNIRFNVNDYSSKSIVEEVYQQIEKNVIAVMTSSLNNSFRKKHNNNYKTNNLIKKFLNQRLFGDIHLRSNVDIEEENDSIRKKRNYKRVTILLFIFILGFVIFMMGIFPYIVWYLGKNNILPEWWQEQNFSYSQILATVPTIIGSYFLYKALDGKKNSELLDNKISIQHIEMMLEFNSKCIYAKKISNKKNEKLLNKLGKINDKSLLKTHRVNKIIRKYIKNLYKTEIFDSSYVATTLILIDDLDRLSNEKINNILQGISFIQKEQKNNSIIFLVPMSYEKFYENETFMLNDYHIKKGNDGQYNTDYSFKNNAPDGSISLANNYLNKIFNYKVFAPLFSDEKIEAFVRYILDKPLQYNFFMIKNIDLPKLIGNYFSTMLAISLRDISAILNDFFIYYDLLKEQISIISYKDIKALVLLLILNICHLRYNYIEFAEKLINEKKYMKFLSDMILKITSGKSFNNADSIYDDLWLKFKVKESIVLKKLDNFINKTINYFKSYLNSHKGKNDFIIKRINSNIERIIETITDAFVYNKKKKQISSGEKNVKLNMFNVPAT